MKNQSDSAQGKDFLVSGGSINYNVRMLIRARRPIELDRIVDLLFVGLMFPIKHSLRANSIEVHPPFCVGQFWGRGIEGR